ncbi:MAG: hypothetical protein VXY93_17510, partial [Pseudomonadota bacterium]|nr:hypothetical protein [Pseudomonadota bacterium]
ILEDGWITRREGGNTHGTMGMMFGIEGKIGRRKLHPKAGHEKQYLERDKMLAELRKITGLHPFFYAKHDHTDFIMDNVIRPILPNS